MLFSITFSNRSQVCMRKTLVYIWMCLLLTAICGKAVGADQAPLRFGVFPRWNAQIMVREFTPLAQMLSTTLNREVIIETDKNFSAFMSRVYAQEFDLVHLNQLQYIQAHQHAGYTAIAKLCESSDCTMRALIVARADTAIQDIADLRGKTIAFGDPNAMVSHILAREILRAHGLQATDYRAVFTKNPPNALLTAYNGAADAAGIGSPVFQRPEIINRIDLNKLHVLAESESIPTLPIAVRAGLDAALIADLKAALLALDDSAAGREALRHISASYFASANDAEYAALKPLVPPNIDAAH
jgi:phosphonate transport system substrate-binding protein